MEIKALNILWQKYNLYLNKSDLYTNNLSVACAGFILAEAENIFRRGKKNQEGQNHAKKFSAPLIFILPPPAEFDSAPGVEPTRGGAEIKKGDFVLKNRF